MANTDYKAFREDPFVIEALRVFQRADEAFERFLDCANRKKANYEVRTAKTLSLLANDQNLEEDFRQACDKQIEALIKKSEKGFTLSEKMKELGSFIQTIGQREAKLCFLITYLPANGMADIVTPDGRRMFWLLNTLICALVEHAKANHPNLDLYSAIARIFDSTSFKMQGWKKSKSSSRKKIFDHFSFFTSQAFASKIGIPANQIYSKIHFLLTQVPASG